MSDAMIVALMAGAGAAALGLGALLTALAARVAARIGFVDKPGGHKSHRAPTPYGGGSAMFVAAWALILVGVGLALALPPDWLRERFGEGARAYAGGVRDEALRVMVLFLGALILHALGLIDDRRPLGPHSKLLVIVGVSVLAATVGEVRVAEFAGEAGSLLITIAWFVVIINAMNFLDNMDGLSAGIGAICLLFFAVCGRMSGQVLVPGLGCVFLGATLGFLLFNFPPARIFMGDAGSLLLGYELAVLSTLTTYVRGAFDAPPLALAIPLIVLAVPLYDFASVMFIRISEGRNPMRGDQRHFSHRLVEHGLSRRSAVLTIYLATATTGLAATLLPGADLRVTLSVVAVVVMVLGIVAILESPPRSEA